MTAELGSGHSVHHHRHTRGDRRQGVCRHCRLAFRGRGYCYEHQACTKCCWNLMIMPALRAAKQGGQG